MADIETAEQEAARSAALHPFSRRFFFPQTKSRKRRGVLCWMPWMPPTERIASSPVAWASMGVLWTAACIPIILIERALANGTVTHIGQDICNDRATENGFIGDSDFYGLGIRVGLYMQWLASLIANVFLPEERALMAAAYGSFSVALYIAFILLLFRNECVYTAEMIVLLNIMWTGAYVVLIPVHIVQVSATSAARQLEGIMGKKLGLYALYDLIIIVLSPITAWFWVTLATNGETIFSATPGGTSFLLFDGIRGDNFHMACQFMAFFTIWLAISPITQKLSAAFLKSVHPGDIAEGRAGFKGYMKIAVLLLDATNFFTVAYTVFSFTLYSCVRTVDAALARRNKFTAFQTWGKRAKTQETINEWALAILCFFILVASILGVELTLLWNNVTGVYTAGDTAQVMPLVLAAFIIGGVLRKILGLDGPESDKSTDSAGNRRRSSRSTTRRESRSRSSESRLDAQRDQPKTLSAAMQMLEQETIDMAMPVNATTDDGTKVHSTG